MSDCLNALIWKKAEKTAKQFSEKVFIGPTPFPVTKSEKVPFLIISIINMAGTSLATPPPPLTRDKATSLI